MSLLWRIIDWLPSTPLPINSLHGHWFLVIIVVCLVLWQLVVHFKFICYCVSLLPLVAFYHPGYCRISWISCGCIWICFLSSFWSTLLIATPTNKHLVFLLPRTLRTLWLVHLAIPVFQRRFREVGWWCCCCWWCYSSWCSSLYSSWSSSCVDLCPSGRIICSLRLLWKNVAVSKRMWCSSSSRSFNLWGPDPLTTHTVSAVLRTDLHLFSGWRVVVVRFRLQILTHIFCFLYDDVWVNFESETCRLLYNESFLYFSPLYKNELLINSPLREVQKIISICSKRRPKREYIVDKVAGVTFSHSGVVGPQFILLNIGTTVVVKCLVAAAFVLLRVIWSSSWHVEIHFFASPHS